MPPFALLIPPPPITVYCQEASVPQAAYRGSHTPGNGLSECPWQQRLTPSAQELRMKGFQNALIPNQWHLIHIYQIP